MRIAKIFDCQFFTDLHVVEYPEHVFIIFTKCLSVRDTISEDALAEKLMDGIT